MTGELAVRPRVLHCSVAASLCAGVLALGSPATAGAESPAAPIHWRTAVTLPSAIDSVGYPAKPGAYAFPDAATLGTTTYVAWLDWRADDPYGQRNGEIELRSTSDGGANWGPIINLSQSPTYNEYEPSIASDGSSVVAVAQRTPGGPWGSSTLRLMLLGGAGVETGDLPTSLSRPQLAGSDGAYYLVGLLGGEVGTFYKSTDAGRTWTNPGPFATSTDGCSDGAHVAASGDVVAVAWAGTNCSAYSAKDIRVRVSTDAGASWKPTASLSSTLQNELPPSIAVNGQTVVAAWLTPRSQTSTTVEVARSLDGGATWSAPSRVGDIGPVPGYDPAILAPVLDFNGNQLTLFPTLSTSIFQSEDSGATWHIAGTAPAPDTRTVVATGTGYLALGHQSLNASVGAPMQVPEAPTAVTALSDTRGAIRVHWTAPANADIAPVDYYTVTATPSGATVQVRGSSVADFIGLTLGTAYSFTVTATNAAGTGPASTPSSPAIPTASAAPSAPSQSAAAPRRMSAPKIAVRGRKAIVKWQAAVSNGSPITRYLIDISKGKDKTVGASARKTVFKRLKPGRYRIRIAARNAIGTSPNSTWVKVRIR